MKADIIMLLDSGLPCQQYIVENTLTAEAQFDSLCEELGIFDDLSYVDYGERLREANDILASLGKEIIWIEQVKVNKLKN